MKEELISEDAQERAYTAIKGELQLAYRYIGELECQKRQREFYADIIEIKDVQLHGVKDIDNLIRILENARPCFQSGDADRNYFEQ